MPQAPLKSKPGAKKSKEKVVRNAGVMRKGLRSFAPKAKNAAQSQKRQVRLPPFPWMYARGIRLTGMGV